MQHLLCPHSRIITACLMQLLSCVDMHCVCFNCYCHVQLWGGLRVEARTTMVVAPQGGAGQSRAECST